MSRFLIDFKLETFHPYPLEEEMEVDPAAKVPKKRRQKRPREEEDIMIDSPSTEICKSLKNISKLKSPPEEASSSSHNPKTVMKKQ